MASRFERTDADYLTEVHGYREALPDGLRLHVGSTCSQWVELVEIGSVGYVVRVPGSPQEFTASEQELFRVDQLRGTFLVLASGARVWVEGMMADDDDTIYAVDDDGGAFTDWANVRSVRSYTEGAPR